MFLRTFCMSVAWVKCMLIVTLHYLFHICLFKGTLLYLFQSVTSLCLPVYLSLRPSICPILRPDTSSLASTDFVPKLVGAWIRSTVTSFPLPIWFTLIRFFSLPLGNFSSDYLRQISGALSGITLQRWLKRCRFCRSVEGPFVDQWNTHACLKLFPQRSKWPDHKMSSGTEVVCLRLCYNPRMCTRPSVLSQCAISHDTPRSKRSAAALTLNSVWA